MLGQCMGGMERRPRRREGGVADGSLRPKVGRWPGNDKEDICTLAASGLLDADTVEQRCLKALDCYVGDATMLQYNLRGLLEEIAKCSPSAPQA
ncbi:protein of unknown function [Methylorubrum extorquens DM4]|uniref:Uncharacterized protein n=1 Tax=Methylorubrum extorquens (strain DSM 6343 / CIP 106787 / DM4) TaxID=661410 RepID=C7CEA6_METED|nr:protein of unknown function [Methylorubrum extorquens DM4]